MPNASQPTRVLTVGAKPAINGALAQRDELQVVALEMRHSEQSPHYQSIAYARGSKLSLPSIRQVRQAISEFEPDVVHAFYPRALAHSVLALTSLGSRVPIVSYRGIISAPNRWSPDQWITYLSRRVAAHACESAAVADSLVAGGVPQKNCHVVHNCLTHSPALLQPAHARRELGVAADAFVVMMVANMRRVKGADLLLRAAIACSDLPKLQLVLVGNVQDDEVDRLARDPRLAQRVTLAGYRRSAAALLSAADLFVMPSRAEALSVALLEAMSMGVCPVVSDAGGMKEAVRDEVDGLVFPSENVAALTAAMRRLYGDPSYRYQLARSASGRARSWFSAEAVAKRITGVYRTVRSAA